MRSLAVILLATALCAVAVEPDIKPSIELVVIALDVTTVVPAKLSLNGEQMNQVAIFEARTAAPLIRHETAPENYLFVQTAQIRELSKTDPAEAERQTQALIAQFKAWGVEL